MEYKPNYIARYMEVFMSLKNNIVELIFGIKYSKSFRIPNISGLIADDILYGDDSPFGTDVFQLVEKSGYDLVLKDKNSNNQLRINQDNFILKVLVEENEFNNKYNWIMNNVVKYYKDLFVKYNIVKIQRVGIVFLHKFNTFNKVEETVSFFTNKQVTNVNNVNFTFSKKIATKEAIFRKKDVLDYQNYIFTFIQKNNTFEVSFDFQYYYDPLMPDIRECFLEKIFNAAENTLNNKFYNWVGKYVETK